MKNRKVAEELLFSYLNPRQIADWMENLAFNVRASNGGLYRIDCTSLESHKMVVDDYGYGTSVWPEGLYVEGDVALGLMFYLQDNATRVVGAGCHGYQDDCSPQWNGGDYDGMI